MKIGAFNIPDVGSGAFSFGGGGSPLLYCEATAPAAQQVEKIRVRALPPREVRRKISQFRRIKKDLAVHVKETLVVLDYVLRAILPPIERFNEGGERFLYTVAVF